MKSLAETLKQRRELQEKIEQEREINTMIMKQKLNVPKECDSHGTAYRIRP